MIQLTEIKSLLLEKPAQPNRPAHLSAASGLVQVGPWLYVVADDELHLGRFSLEGDSAGNLHPCFEGTLPLEMEARKAEKPDIEVLTLIPQLKNPSRQALLAIGSGSKKNRDRSVIIPLNAQYDISAPIEVIDLSLFYDFLKKEMGKLNIEGAAIVKNHILLFQRGNKKNKLNATIRLDLDDFNRVLLDPHKYREPRIEIRPYELGEIDQVPLCFTDATSLPSGEIVFTASAENTSDAYLDGACMGSVIGMMDAKGNLGFLEPINHQTSNSKKIKLEGITAKERGSTIDLLLVTDADDATHPATLYSASIHR